MKVQVLRGASDDIASHIRYYLDDQDVPAVASRFRDAVLSSIDQLLPHPRIGAPVRGSIRGLRSWPVQGFEAFRVYYVEDDKTLRVVRVLHGMRNVRRILKKEKLP